MSDASFILCTFREIFELKCIRRIYPNAASAEIMHSILPKFEPRQHFHYHVRNITHNLSVLRRVRVGGM
jgi:hypothetical protein